MGVLEPVRLPWLHHLIHNLTSLSLVLQLISIC